MERDRESIERARTILRNLVDHESLTVNDAEITQRFPAMIAEEIDAAVNFLVNEGFLLRQNRTVAYTPQGERWVNASK
jgi:hypothetical protein